MLPSIDKAIEDALHLNHTDAENSHQVLINAFDRDHRVVFWNKKAADYFGVDKEFAIGQKLEELIPYTRHHYKMHYLDRALLGRPIHIVKDKYEKRSAFYEQWILPVKKDGEVVAALNIVRDID